MAEPLRRADRWVWLAGGAALIAVVIIGLVWGPRLYRLTSDPERMRSCVQELGSWGPVAIVALEVAQTMLAPIPGQAVGAASGFLYGPWLGTLYALSGTVAGSLLLFLLARGLGRPLARRIVGAKSLERLDELARRGGSLFLFLLWLVPFTPDDLACLAAAITPMPLSRFLILMPLARLPGVFVTVWFGSRAARLSPGWWLALLVGLAVAALVVWRWGALVQAAALRVVDRLFRGRRN